MLVLANEGDLHAILNIERTPGHDGFVGRWPGARHLQEMSLKSSRYFLWQERQEVLGFAILQGLEDPDRKTHLKRIAVREPGKGVGGQLLEHLIEWVFTQTETNRLDLDVFTDNERARRAYERAGFVTEGMLRDFHKAETGEFRSMWLMSILRREWRTDRSTQPGSSTGG